MKQLYASLLSYRRHALALLLAMGGSTLAAQAQANNALLFNGTTKYVQANTVSLNTATGLTLEGWVKVTAFKTSSPFISSIMGIEDGNLAAMLRFGDAGIPASKMQFILTVGTIQYKVTSATTFAVNTWYHVAGTYDGTTMKMYINGVLDNSTSVTGTSAATGVFYLGRNYEALRTLNGSLDELRVWRRPLTAAELVANSCAVSATATGLEAYWRLDEGTGLVAGDLSGHGHAGTLTGMTATDWTTVTPALCARVTATANAAGIAAGYQVVPTENPVTSARAEVELRGMAGQRVALRVLNALGQVVSTQEVQATSAAERVAVAMPGAAGLYVVRATASAGSVTTKLLKR
jgi:hypothetical protein